MAWPATDVGQFVQLQFQGQYGNGQQWRNSYHVWGHDSASPVEVSDLTGLLSSAWMDAMLNAYVGLLSSASSLTGVLARQVHDPLNPNDVKNEAFRASSASGATGAAQTGPTEICAVMHLGTDAAGRSAHGRVFLPWTTDITAISGENFVTSYRTLMATLATQLEKLFYTSGSHATGGAVDFDLAIYSATRRAAGASQYGYRVTAAQGRPKVHWLRSRTP